LKAYSLEKLHYKTLYFDFVNNVWLDYLSIDCFTSNLLLVNKIADREGGCKLVPYELVKREKLDKVLENIKRLTD
jgi:hypothetical protein